MHDYTRKQDVAYTAVFAPDCTPQSLLNHEALWNHAEKIEDATASKRFPGHCSDYAKNTRSIDRRNHVINTARVAFSDNIALPKELTLQQSISLVQAYVQEHVVAHGLAASVAIHWEEGNPHFHIQTTTRTLQDGQFNQNKCRALNDRSFLVSQRQGLAQLTNQHLEMAGLEARVDHRSYQEQGIALAPTRHQGWQSKRLEAQYRYTRIGTQNQKIREDNIRLLAQDPTQIIKKVANERAVFTHEDIAVELFKMVGGDTHLFQVLQETLLSIEIPGPIGRAANNNLKFSGTLGYVRVSMHDQNPARQLEGIQIDHTFTDMASGKDVARPQLEAMMKFACAGDIVIVHSMDRLARNLDDLRRLVQILTQKGVEVRFLKEGMSFTGEDAPMSKLMLSVMGAFAEFERALIKERQREGIAIAKRKGLYRGRKKALSQDQQNDLRERVTQGEKKSVLAREFHISRETIYKYLRA